MNAPPGSDDQLSRDALATVKVEKHIWLKWWGGQPLHLEEAHAANIIGDAGLKEAHQDDPYGVRRSVFHHTGRFWISQTHLGLWKATLK